MGGPGYLDRIHPRWVEFKPAEHVWDSHERSRLRVETLPSITSDIRVSSSWRAPLMNRIGPPGRNEWPTMSSIGIRILFPKTLAPQPMETSRTPPEEATVPNDLRSTNTSSADLPCIKPRTCGSWVSRFLCATNAQVRLPSDLKCLTLWWNDEGGR